MYVPIKACGKTNSCSTHLPAYIMNPPPTHTHRSLHGNELQTLPSGIFDGLGSVTEL